MFSFLIIFWAKNCSYELLGLLDIVRPRLNLQQQFAHHVIPAQTVKAIAQQTDLISEVVYRPADTQLHDHCTLRSVLKPARPSVSQ